MNSYRTMISRIDAYLIQRRQLGISLSMEGRCLMRFARFADRAGHRGPLTTALAIQWATALRKPNALTSAYRMGMIRRFARAWHLVEPKTEVPPPHLFGRIGRRITPHIYTDKELRDLIDAAQQMKPQGCLRAPTLATIFGLIAATGLRVSEAIGLKRTDVRLDQALLHIRHAKFGKFRWVPLHQSAVHALRRYVQCRDQDPMSAGTDAFFVFDRGEAVTYRRIAEPFRRLRRRLRWRARGGYPVPRIHDIRHTFVCRRLELWSKAGTDFDANILALSTYIGHVKPTLTYWYVTATPQLLAIAAQRFERSLGEQP